MILHFDHAPQFPLGLLLEECLTAYELVVNGERLGGRGYPGETEDFTLPAFGPRIFMLPRDQSVFHIKIRFSNFHFRKSGLITPPVIGALLDLQDRSQSRAIVGGILIGLILMSSAYQFMRYLHRRSDKGKLYYGLWSLVVGVHFLCLHNRWMYQLLGFV